MRVSSKCFAVLGLAYVPPWTVNAGFVVGNTHTLIIDTGASASAAATIHGYARAVRPSNDILVINTERHLDHVGGNAYFRDFGIDVYGHARIARTDGELAESIDEYNACIPNKTRRDRHEGAIPFVNTRIANPNQAIVADMELELGRLSVQIILTPGHTPTNLSVFVPDDGVLFCVDCVVSDYLPNLEGGTEKDWQMWLHSLDRIRALAPNVLVPGHGRVVQGQEVMLEIQRVQQIVEKAIGVGFAPTKQAKLH